METVVQSVLILILMILVILLMSEIGRLQGTARVINYAGLVRGATQREVKLEITGYQNDELIEYLDDILNGLKYGDGNYNLITLDDTDYNKKLDAQIEYWGNLKRQIRKVRELGYEDTDIVEVSETYFDMADETVFAAENYSVQTDRKNSRTGDSICGGYADFSDLNDNADGFGSPDNQKEQDFRAESLY